MFSMKSTWGGRCYYVLERTSNLASYNEPVTEYAKSSKERLDPGLIKDLQLCNVVTLFDNSGMVVVKEPTIQPPLR